MKNTRKKIITVIVCISIIAASFTLGYFTRFLTSSKEIRTLDEILKVYKNHYYYESDDIVGAMTEGLFDKYSAYYTPEEYAGIVKTAKGERIGIGLSIDSTLKIVKVTGNSPCERAGVKVGGYIIAVDIGSGKTEMHDSGDFSGKLAGVKENENVKLFIDYGGEEEEYLVKKEEYEESFVHYLDDSGYYSFIEEGGNMQFKKIDEGVNFKSEIGYISLSAFNGKSSGLYGSSGQVKAALDKFKESGKTHLVFDLRGNGGGYMDILCSIASHFVGKGKRGEKLKIAYSEDKKGKREYYYANSDYFDYGFEKITLLADKNTASASEALMGAMIDYHENYDLAELEIIVEGESTYGKGIMQTTYTTLVGAVKLTTAKIYFPLSFKCIHERGISSDGFSMVKQVEVGEGLDGFYAEK